jgi:uncharacterized repeat protein (TIGR04138 family)
MPSRISTDSGIHFGKPCVAGTRIKVEDVIELVRDRIPFHEITSHFYPDLTIDDVHACIQHSIVIDGFDSSELPAGETSNFLERGDYWQTLAAELGIPFDALRFVWDAIEFAPQYHGHEPGGGRFAVPHLNAAEFCDAFLRYTKDMFGKRWEKELTDWNLDTSDKLGRVVFALIDRGLLQRDEHDRESDFDGQLDLRRVQGTVTNGKVLPPSTTQ